MKTNDLTILLTLKGRHLHTLRWLWHANHICLPFHVIVADGEVHPTIARLLSNPETFPNLSFEYHRYEDRSFSDFYYKCADALGKVRTPYVMMSDNDDFLFPLGLQRSIAFLDSAPEYVCAGGGTPGFCLDAGSGVAPNVVGSLHRISYQFLKHHKSRDLDNSSTTLRVLDELKNYFPIYYHVYRIEALCLIAHEIQAYDFSDLDIHERYWALRALTLGKVRSDPSFFFYFRQAFASMMSAYKIDWIDHLLQSRFPQDFRNMASKIAAEAARVDGCDPAELENQIREVYSMILRKRLPRILLRHQFPILFSLKQRFSALRLGRIIPVSIQRKLDETRFWKQLALNGATDDTIAIHAQEFADIEATLQGDEFIKFISRNAPELLAAP